MRVLYPNLLRRDHTGTFLIPSGNAGKLCSVVGGAQKHQILTLLGHSGERLHWPYLCIWEPNCRMWPARYTRVSQSSLVKDTP